jgi:predicted nucleic acid-binding protein
MIVVDANVIAALILPTSDNTEAATAALETDRDWVAPVLWRSEFRKMLATGVRSGWFELELALEAMETAEELMEGGEYSVGSADVLRLAAESGCTGYDSEYVVLAKQLSVGLITLDKALLRSFPDVAVALSSYAG